jgi:translocation and assembly module TamA
MIVDGVSLTLGVEPNATLIRALEAHRNRDAVPITIRVRPGKVFGLRKIEVVERDEPGPPAISNPLKV